MKISSGEVDSPDLINLTPLIDIVFLLLIFFMVTSSFREDERDLKVVLPGAANGDPIENLPELLMVAVNEDGSLHVGGRRLDQEELKRLLERAREKNATQRVMIRAHRRADVRHLVVVLDICAGLGIHTSIATSPAGGGPPKDEVQGG